MTAVSHKRLALAAISTLAVLTAACGGGSSSGTASGTRTIDVDMHDIGFSPTNATVKAGETVQFVFHNKGAIAHDAYIGDETAQMSHESQMSTMSEMGGMEHGNDGITVDPGKTGTLTHTFDHAGTTLIGCHQQGHYAAGMKMNVTVT